MAGKKISADQNKQQSVGSTIVDTVRAAIINLENRKHPLSIKDVKHTVGIPAVMIRKDDARELVNHISDEKYVQIRTTAVPMSVDTAFMGYFDFPKVFQFILCFVFILFVCLGSNDRQFSGSNRKKSLGCRLNKQRYELVIVTFYVIFTFACRRKSLATVFARKRGHVKSISNAVACAIEKRSRVRNTNSI
jgi:hypothetical protein